MCPCWTENWWVKWCRIELIYTACIYIKSKNIHDIKCLGFPLNIDSGALDSQHDPNIGGKYPKTILRVVMPVHPYAWKTLTRQNKRHASQNSFLGVDGCLFDLNLVDADLCVQLCASVRVSAGIPSTSIQISTTRSTLKSGEYWFQVRNRIHYCVHPHPPKDMSVCVFMFNDVWVAFSSLLSSINNVHISEHF